MAMVFKNQNPKVNRKPNTSVFFGITKQMGFGNQSHIENFGIFRDGIPELQDGFGLGFFDLGLGLFRFGLGFSGIFSSPTM